MVFITQRKGQRSTHLDPACAPEGVSDEVVVSLMMRSCPGATDGPMGTRIIFKAVEVLSNPHTTSQIGIGSQRRESKVFMPRMPRAALAHFGLGVTRPGEGRKGDREAGRQGDGLTSETRSGNLGSLAAGSGSSRRRSIISHISAEDSGVNGAGMSFRRCQSRPVNQG